jgi:hypothetical protein
MRKFLIIAAVLLNGCGKSFPPTPASLFVREPHADSVESVIFVIGDAGKATLETSPILHRLHNEIEQWSKSMRDSTVIALFLGDNVYPVGLRDADDPAFAEDSTHMQGQLDVVSGEEARRHGTRAVFIAGNHDWGHMAGEPGRVRVANMHRFIARRSRAGGFHAEFEPRAGDPGPGVIILGRYLKLLLIDTAWWLLEANPAEKDRFIAKLEREMANRGDRELVIAAHHPWQSGSAHGGLVPFWQTIGVKWLLSRSGASLQDLNSLPYRDLKTRIAQVFAQTKPPLLFAGGHDHNLQVLKGTQPGDPPFSVVSGAGSKGSDVGPTEGMLFRRAEPGFMRLVVLKSGAIDLFVVSANEDFLDCSNMSEFFLEQCLETGAREFRTVFSTRLR